jgi:hypothetical protein
MTEKSVSIIREMAEKLSIVNVDGHVTFIMKEDIEKDGKTFDHPTVHIHEEVLDSITDSKASDNTMVKEIIHAMDIVA